MISCKLQKNLGTIPELDERDEYIETASSSSSSAITDTSLYSHKGLTFMCCVNYSPALVDHCNNVTVVRSQKNILSQLKKGRSYSQTSKNCDYTSNALRELPPFLLSCLNANSPRVMAHHPVETKINGKTRAIYLPYEVLNGTKYSNVVDESSYEKSSTKATAIPYDYLGSEEATVLKIFIADSQKNSSRDAQDQIVIQSPQRTETAASHDSGVDNSTPEVSPQGVRNQTSANNHWRAESVSPSPKGDKPPTEIIIQEQPDVVGTRTYTLPSVGNVRDRPESMQTIIIQPATPLFTERSAIHNFVLQKDHSEAALCKAIVAQSELDETHARVKPLPSRGQKSIIRMEVDAVRENHAQVAAVKMLDRNSAETVIGHFKPTCEVIDEDCRRATRASKPSNISSSSSFSDYSSRRSRSMSRKGDYVVTALDAKPEPGKLVDFVPEVEREKHVNEDVIHHHHYHHYHHHHEISNDAPIVRNWELSEQDAQESNLNAIPQTVKQGSQEEHVEFQRPSVYDAVPSESDISPPVFQLSKATELEHHHTTLSRRFPPYPSSRLSVDTFGSNSTRSSSVDSFKSVESNHAEEKRVKRESIVVSEIFSAEAEDEVAALKELEAVVDKEINENESQKECLEKLKSDSEKGIHVVEESEQVNKPEDEACSRMPYEEEVYAQSHIRISERLPHDSELRKRYVNVNDSALRDNNADIPSRSLSQLSIKFVEAIETFEVIDNPFGEFDLNGHALRYDLPPQNDTLTRSQELEHTPLNNRYELPPDAGVNLHDPQPKGDRIPEVSGRSECQSFYHREVPIGLSEPRYNPPTEVVHRGDLYYPEPVIEPYSSPHYTEEDETHISEVTYRYYDKDMNDLGKDVVVDRIHHNIRSGPEDEWKDKPIESLENAYYPNSGLAQNRKWIRQQGYPKPFDASSKNAVNADSKFRLYTKNEKGVNRPFMRTVKADVQHEPIQHEPNENNRIYESFYEYTEDSPSPYSRRSPYFDTPLLSVSQTSQPSNTSTRSPTSPISTADHRALLSVSGKVRCAHCGAQLGRGSAMIIEALGLFYHVECFRCCVCAKSLGSGDQTTDVRVRNGKLHCEKCYSNDALGVHANDI